MSKTRIKYLIISSTVFLLLIIIISRFRGSGNDDNSLTAQVIKGQFRVVVSTSGELEAQNSVKVYGPQNLGRANVWNIKIVDIIPEGTSVKKGDYIAQLDRTDISEKINNFQLEVNNILLELDNVKLDTAIELQDARNNLENLQSAKASAKLEVEKSVYEPPVIIKQAEAALVRAERDYEQAIQGYKLKKDKAAAKVQSSIIKYQQSLQQINFLNELVNNLTIFAPEEGMLIYKTDHMGGKAGKDANIDVWNPVVAELPDLNKLSSKTFVNEVDIRKLQLNQVVEIGFDAFPTKKMTGKVVSIANIGETIFGGNAKVFRVDIKLDGSDKDIKPGMTTSNAIIISEQEDALLLPIETVFNQGDTLNYVFLQKKFSVQKKEVLLGERNDQNVEIVSGLEENDKILFLPPKNSEELTLLPIDDKQEKPGLAESINQ